MNNYTIKYLFGFTDGQQRQFEFNFNPDTQEMISDQAENAPWTELDFHRCRNCTLQATDHPYCPIATNLQPLIAFCSDRISHDEVHIEVVDSERKISLDTTIQRGISSVLGLIMASSACPHTLFLRPMARFHLPFASHEETVYRATSMYLLAQYYINKESGHQDNDLTQLRQYYHSLQAVNRDMAKRLRAASLEDAAANAITLLDLYAKAVPYSIEEALDEIKPLFSVYLSNKHYSQE